MVHMCAWARGLSSACFSHRPVWGVACAPGRFGVPPNFVVGFYLAPTGLGKRMCVCPGGHRCWRMRGRLCLEPTGLDDYTSSAFFRTDRSRYLHVFKGVGGLTSLAGGQCSSEWHAGPGRLLGSLSTQSSKSCRPLSSPVVLACRPLCFCVVPCRPRIFKFKNLN